MSGTADVINAFEGIGGARWQKIKPSTGEAMMILVLAVAIAALGLGNSKTGALVAPLIGAGLGAAPSLLLDVMTAVLISGAIWVNLILLRLLPFAVQVGVVWVELVVLFIAFIDSFDRDFNIWFQVNSEGTSNLAFLVTTGAVTTLYVSLISIFFASCLAMVTALGRLSRNGPAYGISTFFISFFRGTPLLLQVYLIYIGLPQLGPQFALDAVPAGVLALSLCYGAYMAEIFRAGILGVPRGQTEAALALGLPSGVIFRKIVFPQAMRLIVPPTGNQFIAMLKDSALVSVMGVWELTKTAQIIGKRDFKVFEMLIAAALVYWAMSICFELIQSRLESHYGKGTKR